MTDQQPETVTEWAVRFEEGEIWERPTREAAMVSVRGIQSRGGTAAVVSRHVTRTAWEEQCPRCHGRTYVPDFTNGLNEYGEPGKKPCPNCQTGDPQ